MEMRANIVLDTIRKVNDSGFGCHTIIGISNLTSGRTPPKEIKQPLKNAFYTLARKNKLDSLICNTNIKYQILPENNEYMVFFNEFLEAEGMERISKLSELISK